MEKEKPQEGATGGTRRRRIPPIRYGKSRGERRAQSMLMKLSKQIINQIRTVSVVTYHANHENLTVRLDACSTCTVADFL
jgi:hypothetical protein